MGLVAAFAVALAAQGGAQWIWAPGEPIPPKVYFRKSLTLTETPRSANLSITCDNAYELYVNGDRIAGSASWYVMQSANLRGHLHRGANVLAVAGTNLDGPAGLLIDGSFIATDSSWKTSTRLAPGWKSVGFDDSGWDAARALGPEGIQPWGHPTREADFLISTAKPTSVRKPAAASPDVAEGYTWPKTMTGVQGRFVRQPIGPVSMDVPAGTTIRSSRTVKVDFGREVAGWVEVEVETPGTRAETPTPFDVKIRVGEAQTPQGPFATSTEHIGNRTIYRLMPTGAFTGFRFAWIDISHVTKPVKLRRVEAIWRMWPANYDGAFESSDPLLNRIWHICAYTAHMNLDPVAMSAILRPERGDRFPWMGDDRVTHRTVLNVFGGYDLVKADLDYFVKPDDKKIEINNIPGYTLDWVIALYDYWMYSGDGTEVKRHLADVRTILQSLNTQGTPPGWLFTDWEPGLQATTDESVTAFHAKYVEAARLSAVMARKMGSTELADEFKQLGEARTAFLESRSGWPGNLGQHSLTNALLAGFKAKFPDEMAGYSATPYFSYYILEALSEAGQDGKALEALRTYWGRMVRLGATSTWEYFLPSWVGKVKRLEQPPMVHIPGTGNFEVSLCHPWSSGAAAWLSEHVLGVTPAAPGFTECTIRPFFGNLARARGSVPTPHGKVLVSWARQGGKVKVIVQCPPGVKAEVILGTARYRVADTSRHVFVRSVRSD